MVNKKKTTLITVLAVVTFLLLAFFIFFKSGLVIKLNGENSVDVEVGDNYQELGASLLIDLDELKISGEVDTSTLGTYEIKYQSLFATKIRKVNVIDSTRPVITLKGSAEYMLPLTVEYKDPGYEALDNYDGDITSNVIISGTVDCSTPGSYDLLYEVSDSSGNKIRERRIVTVLEDSPLTANVKDFSLDNVFPDTILAYTDEDTSDKEAELTFFGDSIMGNLGFHHAIEMNNNFWTRSSMTPENIYDRIININCRGVSNFIDELGKHKPNDIIILIGTVMVSDSSIEYFIETYEEFIKTILEVSPDTHYIIMSLLPVCNQLEIQYGRNDKINKINYYLCELCQKYGLDFMNGAEALKDENGALKAELAQADMMHPNEDGSVVLADYIRHHLSY